MTDLVKKGTLVDLPVFNRFPSADKHHDHGEIFEMVSLTTKPIPQTTPSYSIQYHGGVIGRNEAGDELYFASQTMKRDDGIRAYPNVERIQVDNLESYVIPSENAYRELHL
jgi:hypothetical protein